ncbi:Endonuclease-reverse transcriptase [Operophtera brumata]|uniref:Endonuclease-reverse transcriptase n=1 Tax=Operophtera brumata TaxID=104452 RepID=A0A0L7LHH7_OPEBR|nr:Endonuclease-reverse transcriptase [Operophtera brumata]
MADITKVNQFIIKYNLVATKTRPHFVSRADTTKKYRLFGQTNKEENLVFFGVEETERNYEDLLNLILDIIIVKMEIKCGEIETVTRIGKHSEKIQPLVVAITTTSRKLEILRKKKSLGNTGMYCKEDYSPAVLQKQKELQVDLKRQWESGKKLKLFVEHPRPKCGKSDRVQRANCLQKTVSANMAT